MPLYHYNVVSSLMILLSLLLTIVAQNCSNQEVIAISAGEFHNTTIPSANCFEALLQYSDGTHRLISTSPSSCLGSNVPSNLSIGLRHDTPVGPLNLTVSCNLLAPACYTFSIQPPRAQSNTIVTDSLNASCQAASPPFPTGGSALALGGASGSTGNMAMPQATSATANAGSSNDTQPIVPGAKSSGDSQASGTVPSGQQDLQSSNISSQTSSIPSSTAMSEPPGQTNNQDGKPTPMSSDQASNQPPNSSPPGQQPNSQAAQAGETPSASDTQTSGLSSVASESNCPCSCPSTSTATM